MPELSTSDRDADTSPAVADQPADPDQTRVADVGFDDGSVPVRNTARNAAVGVGLILAVLIGVFAVSGTVGDDEASSPLVGTRVPELSGITMDVNGQGIDSFDIDNWRGSWVVVNFFATWCPPCVAEHADLVAVSSWGAPGGEGQSLIGAETKVVSVVFNDTEEQVGAFFTDRGGDWPVINNAQAAIDFRVAQVPESFIVAPDGTVVSHYRGQITANDITAVVTTASGIDTSAGAGSGN